MITFEIILSLLLILVWGYMMRTIPNHRNSITAILLGSFGIILGLIGINHDIVFNFLGIEWHRIYYPIFVVSSLGLIKYVESLVFEKKWDGKWGIKD